MYSLVYTKKAKDDIPKIKAAGLEKKVKALLTLLKENPYQSPPSFKKLRGDMKGAFSRRINMQHRLIYEVNDEEKLVKIIRIWTHYDP